MAETARADRHGRRPALSADQARQARRSRDPDAATGRQVLPVARTSWLLRRVTDSYVEWRNAVRERSLEYRGSRLTSTYQLGVEEGPALDGAAARRDDELIRWNRFQPHVLGV